MISNIFHKELAAGKWHQMPLAMQMGNIWSEMNRFIKNFEKDSGRADQTFNRMLELIDLSINDPRWKNRSGEFLRLREIVCDMHEPKRQLTVSFQELENYFLPFAMRALNDR